MSLIEPIVAAAFPAGPPARLVPLLRAPLDPLSFDLGPILPLRHPGPRRVFVADRPDPVRWRSAVCSAFPDPALAAFLDQAPPGVRRMIDTDGTRADVYLDDLQLHGSAHMCEIFSWPERTRSRITFVEAVPEAFSAWARLEAAGGRLALRQGLDQPPRLLWITEARWQGTTQATEATLADWIGLPDGYRALAAEVQALGHRAYVDALDVRLDGGADLTVGFL